MDCADHMAKGSLDSGVYDVLLDSNRKEVYCDMTTDGGAWTVGVRAIFVDENENCR